jgi:hypothetical protein
MILRTMGTARGAQYVAALALNGVGGRERGRTADRRWANQRHNERAAAR